MKALRKAWKTLKERYQSAQLQAFRARIHREAKVNIHAKCPACGHTNGRIEWKSDLKAVMHECQVCFAKWGERPVVEASAWN